ncbi:mitochondrial membrane protein [Coemansia sp. RSA 1646]|nr:mitochondrial membrane protein [Coemansia sp. RSA 1646]KAJ1769806.1 mitochondrial membrane protein [Coemansia sp. RSA 1843]KAJ2091262.1 mitochondrial membrane protein [Coemansia sp. RSA 986]KAJ2216451.1 mitochondrial membrane protein [Coemansia sp. RSA 487]
MANSDGYIQYAAEAEEVLTDEEILVLQRHFEREHPNVRVQTRFNYAWGLTKGNKKQQQKHGIEMMHEIYDKYPERRRECMYYLAMGYYRTGEYNNARVHIERLLALEPSNTQARDLRKRIEDKLTREGLIGLAMTGGVVAIVGIAAAAIFGRKSK